MSTSTSRNLLKLIRTIRLTNVFGYIFGCVGAGGISAWMLITIFGRMPHSTALAAALPFAIAHIVPVTLSIVAVGWYWYRVWHAKYKENKNDYKNNQKLLNTEIFSVEQSLTKAEGATNNNSKSNENSEGSDNKDNNNNEEPTEFQKLKAEIQSHIVEDYFIETSCYGIKRTDLRTKQVGRIEGVIKILEKFELQPEQRAKILKGCLITMREQAQEDHQSHTWFGITVGNPASFFGLTKSNLVQAIDKTCPVEYGEGKFLKDEAEIKPAKEAYNTFKHDNPAMNAPIMLNTFNPQPQ